MASLPPEIWAMVLSYMDRSDILNIALVSRAFPDQARRILSQTVTLHGKRLHGYQEHIEHLRYHGLLPLIKKLVVKTVPSPAIPWAEMPNLLSLTLSPIRTEKIERPQDWTKTLNALLLHLAVFELEDITVLSGFPLPPGELAIPNIMKVAWSEGGSLSPPFFSLCQASLQSITNLTVFITDDPFETTETYAKLWKLRFPKLCLLNVGPGGASFHIDDFAALEEAFTQFLHAHPTIESLTMNHVYDQDFDMDIYLPLHSATVTRTVETILPNLTFLHAHPHQTTVFVNEDARFLKTLRTLSLPQEPYLDVGNVLLELLGSFAQYNQRNGTPSGVRHLSLFLFDVGGACALDIDEFQDIMFRTSEIFPALEVWESAVGRVTDLLEYFPKFEHLKKLHCRTEYGNVVSVDEVRKLAVQYPSLETCRCLNSGREFGITREGTEGRARIRVSIEGQGKGGENDVEECELGDESEGDGEFDDDESGEDESGEDESDEDDY